MIDFARVTAVVVALCCLSGCGAGGGGRPVDGGFDAKELSNLKAGIWIDPNGCDHWIIDDGLEGYMSQRLSRTGKPVCSQTSGEPGTVRGPFKSGSAVPDLL